MGKGGSKQCFITLPSLAASTNGLPPSMRAREMVFCKEGVSQRLWRSWPLHFPSFNSTCCRDAQPNAWAHCSANAEHDAGEGWGFAGPPPALVIACHASIQQGGLTIGDGCVGAPGAACPQGTGVMGSGHPGTILATEPAQQWGSHAGVAAAPAAAEARARLHAPLPLATCRPGSSSQPPQAF